MSISTLVHHQIHLLELLLLKIKNISSIAGNGTHTPIRSVLSFTSLVDYPDPKQKCCSTSGYHYYRGETNGSNGNNSNAKPMSLTNLLS